MFLMKWLVIAAMLAVLPGCSDKDLAMFFGTIADFEPGYVKDPVTGVRTPYSGWETIPGYGGGYRPGQDAECASNGGVNNC